MKLYLFLPCLLIAAMSYFVVYWIYFLPGCRDDAPDEIAIRIVECERDKEIWQKVGGRKGISDLYSAALYMLWSLCQRPDLARSRNVVAVMCACLFVITRLCLWVEAPTRLVFPFLPRCAALTSVSIFGSIWGTYKAAIELDPS